MTPAKFPPSPSRSLSWGGKKGGVRHVTLYSPTPAQLGGPEISRHLELEVLHLLGLTYGATNSNLLSDPEAFVLTVLHRQQARDLSCIPASPLRQHSQLQ